MFTNRKPKPNQMKKNKKITTKKYLPNITTKNYQPKVTIEQNLSTKKLTIANSNHK